MKRAKIISVFYAKGGIGKSTLSVNFASYLSTMHKEDSKNKKEKNKVLLIDFDEQSSTTVYMDSYNEDADSIYDVLQGTAKIKDVIIHKEYHYGIGGKCYIDLVPSSGYMEYIEDQYYDFDYPDERLLNVLIDVIYDYDYIVIDCPPEKNSLFKNIFNSTDYFLLAIDGFTITYARLQQTLSKIKELTTIKKPGHILGCCVNKYNPNFMVDVVHNLKSKDLIDAYSEQINIFNTKIPNSCEICSSFTNRMPVPFYHKNLHRCRSINSAYIHLTQEILEEIKKHERQ